MKKYYISPESIELKIAFQHPIAASEFDKDNNGDVTGGNLHDEGAEGPGLAPKWFGFGPDEEDED